MRASLQPQLTERNKQQLKAFLISAFEDPNLCAYYPLPSDQLHIYVDERLRWLLSGLWAMNTERLYMGEDGDLPHNTRLLVLLTLTQLLEPSEELTKASSQAIARYLLGEYNGLQHSLTVSSEESTGLAFSTDNVMASLIAGEWLTPSGEAVDVSGPEWTVCEAPVVPEVTPTNGFHVGQRVRWTPAPVDANDFHPADGVIDRSSGSNWVIRLDEMQSEMIEVWVEAETLTVI